MSGMYTSPERVVRDGYVIAFEGEVMSEEDARRRGLIKDETATEAPEDKTPEAPEDKTPEAPEDKTPDLSKLKKPELLALCEERGITVPNKATVDQLIELLSE